MKKKVLTDKEAQDLIDALRENNEPSPTINMVIKLIEEKQGWDKASG